MDSTFSNFINRLEATLLFQLTLNVKSGKITLDEAQVITSHYLSLQPTSKEELLQKLIELGRNHLVIEPVIAQYSQEFDNEFKETVLSQMRDKISHGDINSAVTLAQKGRSA